MAHLMAEIMAPYTNPVWRSEASILTFIPSTAQAKRNRGFDQAELLAQELSCILDIPYASFFMRPKSRDQRKLSRIERVANLNGHINTLPKTSVPKKILLIDDVCTTGATLAAATVALQNAGAECVWCLTFARTC